jgi:hypothetical protein
MAWVWPGLPQLWRHGSWFGLAAAVAFAVALNIALVNTLIWTEWFGPFWRAMAWMMAGGTWLAGVAWTWRTGQSTNALMDTNEAAGDSPSEDLFSAATREYLQGNWVAAREKLERLLAEDPNDVEARLLLATLYRRTHRAPEARAELERLTKMEKAVAWRFEIERELELIDKIVLAPSHAETETGPTEPRPTTPTCKAA